MKLAKDKICFEKAIRMLTFRSHEKFDNLIYFKIIGIVG